MKFNKIKATTPDKVRDKFVKYRQGDCLSINCNGMYLAVLISEKFNKYYDFTLLEYYKDKKPAPNEFINSKFFGTRFGSWEELDFAVDKRMIECKYIDNSDMVEIVCSLRLIPRLLKASYSYVVSLDELLDYYLKELPGRIEKSANAEKFPDLAFVSRHLVDMRNIILMEPPLT